MRMTQKRPLIALFVVLLVNVAGPALADWQVVFDAEANRTLQLGGDTRRGSFATRAECEAYRSSRPVYEQRHSSCDGFDNQASHKPDEPTSTQNTQKPYFPITPEPDFSKKLGDRDALVDPFPIIIQPGQEPVKTVRPPAPSPYPSSIPVGTVQSSRLNPAQCLEKLKEAETAVHGEGLYHSASILRSSIPVCAGTPSYRRQVQLLAKIESEFQARENRANYFPYSIGLIGGTGWLPEIYDFDLGSVPPSSRPSARMAYKERLKSNGMADEDATAFASYSFVFAMASSSIAAFDLYKRVRYDNITAGQFSGRSNPEYAKLRGRSFDVLDCHSNGAMICLYALLSGDIAATKVRLFGPQITEESMTAWRRMLDPKGFGPKILSLEIYIANGDPIPYYSLNLNDGWYALSTINETPDTSLNPVQLDPIARLQSQECYMDGLLGCFDKPIPKIIQVPCPQATSKRDLACHPFAHYAAWLRRNGQ